MKRISVALSGLIAAALVHAVNAHAAEDGERARIERAVDAAIRPVMAKNDVPGMAVAVTVGGRPYVFNYGVASRESGKKVDADTLFEIGSVSKTFTATLGTYAETRGKLALSDKAGAHLPALAGSSFDKISLLDLGTYMAGGLPLQFPDAVDDHDKLIAYYRKWRPAFAAGTRRVYSNPSIGLFGYLAAQSLGEDFDTLMEKTLFPGLGLKDTFIRVPAERMGDYAFGTSKAGKPIRVTPGVFDSQAYGVKTTATDMIRFVAANMDEMPLDDTLRRAIAGTHRGFYKVGVMTQGLGWEMYAVPTSLSRLLDGNSRQMALEPNKAARISPPQPPRADMLYNKTGSTKGFGAYAAFVPARRIGIVILANHSFPIPERVTAAYRILTALDGTIGSQQ